MELRVSFKGQTYTVHVGNLQHDAERERVTLAQLGEAVSAATRVAYHTVKLLVPGAKGPVIPSLNPSQTCQEAGEMPLPHQRESLSASASELHCFSKSAEQ